MPTPRYDDLRERNGYEREPLRSNAGPYERDAFDRDTYDRDPYDSRYDDTSRVARDWERDVRGDQQADRFDEPSRPPERRAERPAPFEGDPWAEG
jgi:hypothetical protein